MLLLSRVKPGNPASEPIKPAGKMGICIVIRGTDIAPHRKALFLFTSSDFVGNNVTLDRTLILAVK